MKYFRHTRRYRTVSFVLGLVWLPYMATRCISLPGAHADCDMLRPIAHSDTEHADAHHYTDDAPAPAEPQHHHHHKHSSSKQPAHTCCDLTGKCNIKVTSGIPSLAPIQVVAALPVADAPVPKAELRPHRAIPALAHAPPTYLRNVTLLL